MENKQFESIIESLFTIVPLLKKDLIKPELDNEGNDLSPTHLHILFLLEDIGVQSMSEIGRNLQINKSNLTPLIQKLIDKQLVERIYEEKDRRYVNIGLTVEGEKRINMQKLRIANHLKEKLSILNSDELQRFSESLIEVKNIMSKLI
ncbi:MAG: transcriptional regulator [Clostridia bacterium]|nr:transcriptional regulator [Clostridia bacterium]